MPAMVGTERFQQLCSMEYLHEYFKQVLAGKTIALDSQLRGRNGDDAGRDSRPRADRRRDTPPQHEARERQAFRGRAGPPD